jgi:GRF zinc finger
MHPKKQSITTGSNAGRFGPRGLLLRPPAAPPPPTATTRNLLRLMKETGSKKKRKDPTHKQSFLGVEASFNATGAVVRVEKPKDAIHSSVTSATLHLKSEGKPFKVDIFGTVPTKLLAELKPKQAKDREDPIKASKKRKLESLPKNDDPLDLSRSSVYRRTTTEVDLDAPQNRTYSSVPGQSLDSAEPMNQATDEVTALPNNLYCGLKKRKPFRLVQQHPCMTLTKGFNQDEIVPPPMSSDTCGKATNLGIDHVGTAVAPAKEIGRSRDVAVAASSTAGINPYTNAASQAIPRPNTSKPAKKPKDNYVRLNLRNKAGACLGARNVRAKSKSKLQWEQRRKDRVEHFAALQREEEDPGDDPASSRSTLIGSTDALVNQLMGKSTTSATSSTGADVVDDFIDGVFAPPPAEANANIKKKSSKTTSPIPLCSGHHQPCKVLTVKKSGPNRGRQFYACACPRMEQCNHFAWADDTLRVSFLPCGPFLHVFCNRKSHHSVTTPLV